MNPGNFSAFPVPEALCASGDLVTARESGLTKRELLAAGAWRAMSRHFSDAGLAICLWVVFIVVLVIQVLR